MGEIIKKYYIHTYGCQMNVHESEKLAGELTRRGYEEAREESSADIIVFNTCCIRESAETRVLGNLGHAKKLKEANPDLIIAICGCMPQKAGTAEMLKKRCPFIDIIFGTHNINYFGEYLDRVETQREKVIEIWDKESYIDENCTIKRDSGIGAWVNIMYGCNNFCSYCIVPYVKGRERSRSIDAIISEVKELIASGYKEITLLGQNVNSYNYVEDNKVYDFAKLLSTVAELDGEFKIKFMTSHPKDISERVVRTIAEHDKLAKYIHLPLQSGSDRILGLMNRKYTSAEYLKKVDMIRNYMPDCGITSDIIVGFPTETEKDFEDTEEVVKKVGFNNLFTFIYSRRAGTVADKMDGQIDIKTKRARIKHLIDMQFDIGLQIAKAQIGKTFKVLCEKQSGKICYGKSESDLPVIYESNDPKVGQFNNVLIKNHKNTRLYGELKETGEK